MGKGNTFSFTLCGKDNYFVKFLRSINSLLLGITCSNYASRPLTILVKYSPINAQPNSIIDIWFTMVGFLLGTRQTILETKDGGNTWVPRSIPSAEDEDFNYRFNSISFVGKEGWIVGKPAILLYTSDAGENWERIALSAQLPGDMVILYG